MNHLGLKGNRGNSRENYETLGKKAERKGEKGTKRKRNGEGGDFGIIEHSQEINFVLG